MSYQSDKAWSDQYMPYVKSVLGEHLITEAPIEVDQQEATDLRVFTLRPFTVAVRLRRPEVWSNPPWRDEITIRYNRRTARTEWEKMIVDGWGDYMFYGFAGNHGHVRAYTILDLAKLRRFAMHCYAEGNRRWRIMSNHDGSSDFAVIRVPDLVAVVGVDAVVAREGFAEGRAAA